MNFAPDTIEQVRRILNIFKTSEADIRPHFFLTGPSGSGKTYTIEQLCEIGNGNGNGSLGIRIAAEFHARLVEQLSLAVNGELNELEARLLLREVEVVR